MARSPDPRPQRFAGLDQLGALRDELAARAERERIEAARRRVEAARRAREAVTFQSAIGDVVPLKLRAPRAEPWRPAAEPVPAMREADEREALASTLSDGIDVERFLEIDEALSWRRDGVGADVLRDLRRGRWVLQDQLDLHRLRTDEAREALVTFLEGCTKRGVRCVRIVHGKGLGSAGREPVLKHKVPRWLVQRAEVAAFCQAGPNDGGGGAVVVLLAPARRG